MVYQDFPVIRALGFDLDRGDGGDTTGRDKGDLEFFDNRASCIIGKKGKTRGKMRPDLEGIWLLGRVTSPANKGRFLCLVPLVAFVLGSVPCDPETQGQGKLLGALKELCRDLHRQAHKAVGVLT